MIRKLYSQLAIIPLLFFLSGSISTVCAAALSPLQIDLRPASTNPTHPVMGDQLTFQSTITNAGSVPLHGLVAWISLVEIDPGHEQPMDLEDWSAHKAVSGTILKPGEQLATDWPMRLIQHGDYRVVISATDHEHHHVYTSDMLQFHIARKPVVESRRILPVAMGIPALIGGLIGFRLWRERKTIAHALQNKPA